MDPRESTLGLPSNPCRDFLSDEHFLRHMISHHQVAIDMSREAIDKSNDEFVRRIAGRIAWQQDYEIAVMTWHLHAASMEQSIQTRGPAAYNHQSMLAYYEPASIMPTAEYKCDPLFFDPDAHMDRHQSMGHYSDHMFVMHMIPHHQVAVDMSHRLLLHSEHIATREIATKIIRDQQLEIRAMNEWLFGATRCGSSEN